MRQFIYKSDIVNPQISLLGVGADPPGTIKLENVIVSGNYAYVMSGTTTPTLIIYDVSNPAAPVITGQLNGTGNYLSAVQGNYVYFGGSGSSIFYIANVSNPKLPVFSATLTITGSPGAIYGTAIAGNYAYLATQSKGLTVVDVTNPASPHQVFQEGGTLNKSVGVAVQGTKVYTTNYQTTAPWTVRYLKIWDISSTPSTPVLLTTYTLPAGTKPEEVSVYGNYAYVTDANTNSVQIVDVSNPLSPSYLSSMFATALFNVANNVSVDSSGNYAYMTSGNNATYGGAIDFFDITNKSSPVKLKTVQQGVATSVFGASVLSNNLLFVANYGVAPGNAGSLNIYSTQTFLDSEIASLNLFSVSSQVSTTDSTASGILTLQASDDVSTTAVNWTNVAGATSAISGVGASMIPKTDVCYQYIRVVYTNTGTGTVHVSTKALGN